MLGVIILLFVVGVGCGATHGGDVSTHPGWTTTLQDVLVKKATPSDLTADTGTCIQGSSLVVRSAATCNFSVPDTRRILLSPPQGGLVTINVTQRGFSGKQDPTKEGGYDFTLSKDDTFSVTCGGSIGSTPCQLAFAS